MDIVNIAAYKFINILEPSKWIIPIKEVCLAKELRGTIILAKEGINMFLAGTRENIDFFIKFLSNDVLFSGIFSNLEIKESFSNEQPFRKMVVRLANEIITIRQNQINPIHKRAPSVKATELKKWLDQGHDDQGRAVLMLDTRNAFEIEMGKFTGAIDFSINKFSEFPEAIQSAIKNQNINLNDSTVVSYCTGGIRCEKAALLMENMDLERVYQLEGGILKYFEEVGSAHWEGECFVFDERIALDTNLRPSQRDAYMHRAGLKNVQ